MSKDTQAFPSLVIGNTTYVSPGMTLRQWYAGQALKGLLAGTQPRDNQFLGNPNNRTLEQWVSEACFDYADAMIAEGEK